MKKTSFDTLLFAVLLELYLDQKELFPQRNTDSFCKILGGHTFSEICLELQVTPDYICHVATKLKSIFILRGYDFLSTYSKEEDELFPFILSYFNSKGYETLKSRQGERIINISVLGDSSKHPYMPVPTIVTYCCDDGFRSWIRTGALRPSPFPTI